MAIELQKLQAQIDADKKVRSSAFLCNWENGGGATVIGLEASACLPGSEEETATLDYQRHMKTHDDRVKLQTYGKDLSVVDTEILLSKIHDMNFKVIKEGCISGLSK